MATTDFTRRRMIFRESVHHGSVGWGMCWLRVRRNCAAIADDGIHHAKIVNRKISIRVKVLLHPDRLDPGLDSFHTPHEALFLRSFNHGEDRLPLLVGSRFACHYEEGEEVVACGKFQRYSECPLDQGLEIHGRIPRASGCADEVNKCRYLVELHRHGRLSVILC